MADWNYDYRLGPLVLDDVCSAVRVQSEGGSSFIDPGNMIPGRDGTLLDDQAPYGPLDLQIRTVLRYTDENGAVNHADGKAGHVFENLSLIKAQFKPTLVSFRRTVPHIGTVRAMMKLTARPVPEQRFTYLWLVTVPSGSWQANAESSSTGSPATGVITLGDREISDPRVSLPSAGTRTVTTADGLVYTIVAAAGPTYPVVVDVGAGTVTASGGADASGDVTFDHEHWFRFSPNHTHVITGSGTWFWRNRWA